MPAPEREPLRLVIQYIRESSSKKAKNEGRTIVFIDESGLSERPQRCRTWAPRGQTPVLQYHFNWKTLSAMAGVTWWNFYFRLFPRSDPYCPVERLAGIHTDLAERQGQQSV